MGRYIKITGLRLKSGWSLGTFPWASQVKAQLSAEAQAKATAKAEAEEAAKAGSDDTEMGCVWREKIVKQI